MKYPPENSKSMNMNMSHSECECYLVVIELVKTSALKHFPRFNDTIRILSHHIKAIHSDRMPSQFEQFPINCFATAVNGRE